MVMVAVVVTMRMIVRMLMMIVDLRGAVFVAHSAVGTGFRLERRRRVGDSRAKAFEHSLENMVIAESQETAVVYGMPGAAVRAGIPQKVLGLPQIAEFLGTL